jgi:predicted nucleic acid-binding protein
MKTYVFDASALFAFLQQKPGAPKVSELLKEAMRGRAAIFMSAVNYGEVYGGIFREHGPEKARATMSAVHPLPISMVDATPQRAVQAAEIKVRYKLYYLDSFVAALALEHKGTLVTSDADFRRLGQSVPIIWLKV